MSASFSMFESMNIKMYNTQELRPLAVVLERGFAASVGVGVEAPSFDNEDVSNNWQ